MARTKLPATMRALELAAYDGGTPESLRVVEKPLPLPRSGEVLVRITAAPINPSDVVFLRAQYGVRKPLPVVPGFEGSGVVVATGSWKTRALKGRRVACLAPNDGDGTWAEYMRTRAETCIPLAPHISTERGAMLLVNPFTAWGLVDLVRQGGHRAAVQTAAASSVGQMVARLGQRFDLPLIHIVRRPAQVAMLQALGAQHILDSSAPNFDRQLAELCQRLGATIALDAVGGALTGQVLKAMPHGAQVLVYGLLSGQPCQIGAKELIFENKRVEGFWLADWLPQLNPLELLRVGASIQKLLSSDLQTGVRAALPLEDIAFAMQLYKKHMSEGKVLLMPDLRRPDHVQ